MRRGDWGPGYAMSSSRKLVFLLVAQDFVRLFQAELLMEVQMSGSAPAPRLTEWLRGYAERSLKDKVGPQARLSRCPMGLEL